MVAPLFGPGVNVTLSLPLARCAALTWVGASGVPTLIGLLGADRGPVPKLLWAATRNVYALPLVRPVTVSVVAADLNVRDVCAAVPTYGVTTYALMEAPLFDA